MKKVIATLIAIISAAVLFPIAPTHDEYLFLTAGGYGELRIHISVPDAVPLETLDTIFQSLAAERALTLTFFSHTYQHPYHHYFATVSFSSLSAISGINNNYLPFLAVRSLSLVRAPEGGMDLSITVDPSQRTPVVLPKDPVFPVQTNDAAKSPYRVPGVPSLSSNIVAITNVRTNAVTNTVRVPETASERMAMRIDDIMLGRTNSLITNIIAAAPSASGSYRFEVNLPARVKDASGVEVAENIVTAQIPYASGNAVAIHALTENAVTSRRPYRVFKGENSVLVYGPLGYAVPSDHSIAMQVKQKRPGIFNARSFDIRSIRIRKKTFRENVIDCDVEVTASTRTGTLETWRFEEHIPRE
ncbi:MAG: hypothetical protein AABZ39_02845 [Spirochaetota bacterium]